MKRGVLNEFGGGNSLLMRTQIPVCTALQGTPEPSCNAASLMYGQTAPAVIDCGVNPAEQQFLS